MAQLKQKTIIFLVGLVVGFVSWQFRSKPQPTIEYRDKIVEKVVTKRDVVTRTVRLPNGTVTTEVIDKSSVVTDTDKSSETKIRPKPLANYSLGAKAIQPIDIKVPRSYEISAGIRAAGPIWAEIGATTDKKLTLGIRLEF
jgi:hypothetical protein